jgi:tetratricopeptide (TPR) repeat protein
VRTKLVVSLVVSLLALNGVALARSWRVAGALVHMRQNEYEEAIKLLEEDVAESPDNAEAWAHLGDAYAHEAEFMKAAEAWSRAEDLYARRNKEKEIEKILQTREYYWAQAFNKAYESVGRALSFNNPEFVPEEGETVPGNLDKAEEGFVATYRVFDGHPKTLFLLGMVYEEKATYYGGLEAEEPVDVADYDLDTGAPAQRRVKAGEYADEMWDEALDAYEMAVGLKRTDMAGPNWDEKTPLNDYLRELVGSYLYLQRYERALSVIEPLLAEMPNDLTLLNDKATVLDKLDRTGEAIEVLGVIAETTDDPKVKAEVLGRMADYYLKKDYEGRDPMKAIEYLEQALELAPDDYRIYINLGKAYGEIGEYEKGKEFLKKGKELYEQRK